MLKPTKIAEAFFLASKSSEIASLKQLAASVELVIAVSNLMHQLQRERGLSNLFLASNGERLGEQLCQQTEVSIRCQNNLQEKLEQLDLQSINFARSSKLFNNIALVLHAFEELPDLRHKIRHQEIVAENSCLALSRYIDGLLAVIFEAADLSDDPGITRALVAMLNFMQCKEYAGQERAWASLGFAAGEFTQENLDRITTLVTAQANSLETFSEYAESKLVRQWSEFEASRKHKEFDELRRMISRIEPGKPITSDVSEIWYEIATNRMDTMQLLERNQSNALIELSQARISEAENELTKQRDDLNLLPSLDDEVTTISPLVDPELTRLHKPENAVNTGWVRALHDLVQQQAQSLRNMSEELAAAKRALTERKRVERAKGLLMQYHDMTESQAHRQLQKSAMNQKTSLLEVADKLISEFEKLKMKG